MLVTLAGISMLVKPPHPENAESPIHFTLLPIVTFDIFLQFSNAPLPMLVTEAGIVTILNFEELENALFTMIFVPSRIETKLTESSKSTATGP